MQDYTYSYEFDSLYACEDAGLKGTIKNYEKVQISYEFEENEIGVIRISCNGQVEEIERLDFSDTQEVTVLQGEGISGI